MNISREKAEDVAESLTQKIKEERDGYSAEKCQILKDFILSKTPDRVKEFFTENPEWIKRNHVLIHGVSHYESVSAVWKDDVITVDDITAKAFTDVFNKEESANKKLRKVKQEIIQAMLSLKTYARCKEQFPEAYALLPQTSTSTALMVNLDSIRKELNETA